VVQLEAHHLLERRGRRREAGGPSLTSLSRSTFGCIRCDPDPPFSVAQACAERLAHTVARVLTIRTYVRLCFEKFLESPLLTAEPKSVRNRFSISNSIADVEKLFGQRETNRQASRPEASEPAIELERFRQIASRD